MPTPMIDLKSGQTVQVPDEHVQAAFQSKQFGLPQGARIPVQREDGRVGSVDAADLSQEIATGSQVVSQRKYDQAKLQAKYGGAGGMAAAAGEGAARGLTLGLSDPLAIGAARAFGGEEAEEATRQHLAGEKAANPRTALGTEVAGAVIPALMSGGGAAAAEAAEGAGALARAGAAARGAVRTAGILPRAVSGVGSLAEHAAGALLPEAAESAAGRIAVNAVKKAAGASAEGALYGVGQQISEDTLGDHELSAEKLLAAAGHGALVGAALGGLAGGAGQAVTELRSSGLAARVSTKLSDAAGEQAWKALGADAGLATRAEEVGGKRAIGRVLLSEGVIPKEEGLVASALKPEELLPRTQAARQRVEGQIDEVLQSSSAKVPAADVLKPLDDAIASAPKGAEGAIARARDGMYERLGIGKGDVLREAMGLPRPSVPIAQFVAEKQQLEPLLAKLEPTIARQVRDSMAEIEHKAFIAAGESKQGGRALTELYVKRSQLAIAEEAAQKAVENAGAKAASGGEHSLSSLLALGGIVSGHGPAGIALAAGKAAMGFAKKAIADRGNALAAVALDRASELTAIQKANASISSQMDKGIRAFFGKSGAKLAGPVRQSEESKQPTRERYQAKVERVAQMAAAPAVGAERVGQVLGGMGTHAPKTVAAVTQIAQKATTFLQSKIPPTHVDQKSMTPTLEKPRVSDAEMHTFLKYARAVDDPMSVVRDMSEGRISSEGVEALKVVYPKTYQELQTRVLQSVTEQREKLPYDKRVQLGILLQIPTDATLSPDFVKDLQGAFAGHQEGPKTPGGAPAPSAPKRPIEGSMDAEKLGMQSVEQGPGG